ncbi:hypothetical protein [Mucilaginibacter lappiensis]|uniref:Uncharacterized protein n=1 Tax=Mucilaginibacter lappiensis TaxID=354630 RepID=A0A841JI24_9SPHI|nr:hypothetical protein [Mucilaginibacter lappiensis]MBB6130580.1 hypothetical protein [Mucilaginibacter lappiensis]
MTGDTGVVIYGTPITPPGNYSGPGFDNGGSGENGGGGSIQTDGDTSNPYGPQAIMTPLHIDIVNDLYNKFRYSADLTQTQKDNFKNILLNVDGTKSGDKILTALDAYYNKPENANLTKPMVTNKPSSNGGTAAFDHQNNEFDLQGFLDEGNTNSWGIYNVGHELDHTLQWAQNQNPSKVNFELDAYMLAAEMVKEAPADYTSQALEINVQSQLDFDHQNAQQSQFTVAWANFLNGDYSASNYSNLVYGFQQGSTVGQNYLTYNKAPVTTDPNAVPQWLTDLQN